MERGFSINRQIEVENLQENSYSSKRIVCDHIQFVGGVKKRNYHQRVVLTASGARQKYYAYLDEQKRLKDKSVTTNKRKLLMTDTVI